MNTKKVFCVACRNTKYTLFSRQKHHTVAACLFVNISFAKGASRRKGREKMNLVIKDLVKSFDKKQVLKSANFTFGKGKIYGLIGRNGAGKTTLFSCISEDMKPNSGEIFIFEDGEKKSVNTDDVGFVLSEPIVPEFLTAKEFIKFILEVQNNVGDTLKTPDEHLDFIGIDKDDRNKLLKDFSHGMKNKIQMLVNFIANPTIMLLDEPLTSLDVVAAEEMKKLFRHSREQHITILSTHILELALDLCDEIVILHDGKLEQVNKDELDDEGFKAKIINALKGEENDA